MATRPDPPPPPLAAEPPPVGQGPLAWRRPRFGVRTLLRATTLVAVGCAATTVLPGAFSQLLAGGVWIAGASFFASGLLFARGDRQAFCLGATIVLTSMWTNVGGRFMEGVHGVFSVLGVDFSRYALVWADLACLAAAAAANGLLCVWARRLWRAP